MRLSESEHRGVFTVFHAVFIIIFRLIKFVRPFQESKLFAYLLTVLISMVPAQRTVPLINHILSILLAVAVVHLALYLAGSKVGFMGAVQLAVLIGLLFLHTPLAIVHLKYTVFLAVLVCTVAFQLVVFILSILAVVKTVPKFSLYISRVITVYDAVVSVQGFFCFQVTKKNTSVTHIDSRYLLNRILLLCLYHNRQKHQKRNQCHTFLHSSFFQNPTLFIHNYYFL